MKFKDDINDELSRNASLKERLDLTINDLDATVELFQKKLGKLTLDID